MKVAFYTLGCKVNQYETEQMREQFAAYGYEEGSFDQACDVYVINTCTVTTTSDQKSRQMIRRARRTNPAAIVAATGCFVQASHGTGPSLEQADIVTGTDRHIMLVDLVEEYRATHTRLVRVGDAAKQTTVEQGGLTGFRGHTRANLKIQDGCQNYCTYCIIPFVRGPVRSKAPADITQEAAALFANGYKEIVLTGIHITSYGKDTGVALIEALQAANRPAGDLRLRLGSLEPSVLTKDFLTTYARLERFCPHFHLSLQSGCDRTLRRMNRHYTAAQFADAVALARELVPGIELTCDIIAGFPGETEEDFQESLRFVQQIGFLHCHIFGYSARPGTAAAKMPDPIPAAEIRRRCEALAAVAAQSRRQRLTTHLGERTQILIEQEVAPGIYEGLSPHNLPVRVQGNFSKGQSVTVTICNIGTDWCEAEPTT